MIAAPATPVTSALTRKLRDLLHREAHLKLWRARFLPILSNKQSELRALQAARPPLLAVMPHRREAYLSRLTEAQDAVQRLRERVDRVLRCEPHIARMIEDEIENLLREDCPDYIDALAAHRQKEDWLRCLERFSDKIAEFTRALGNVRNLACSGYVRHTQAYSPIAVQAFHVAYAAARQVEEEVRFANRISDAQFERFMANGIDTRALPRLPETAFSAWVSRINSMPLDEAQVQFDTLIQTTKRLRETGVPELRVQADQVEIAQESDIRNYLCVAWEEFRAEVAPEIYPGDTERTVAETERMLVVAARSSVMGRL